MNIIVDLALKFFQELNQDDNAPSLPRIVAADPEMSVEDNIPASIPEELTLGESSLLPLFNRKEKEL